MFAGLAEVSGTVVLPLVEAETQLVYVKFLTFFPCFLVGLFFYTIWKYPTHLYAPSDYVNEDNYVLASGKAVEKKRAQENEGPASPPPSNDDPAHPNDSSGPDEPPPNGGGNTDSGGPTTGGTGSPGDSAPPFENDSSNRTQPPAADVADRRARGYLAEQVVLQRLERELNLSFRRDVSPKNLPDVVIDGLNITDNKITLAEVRVISGMSTYQVNRSLETFLSVLNDLPPTQRRYARVILAIVHPGWNSDRIKGFSERLMATNPLAQIIKPELRFFNLDEVAPLSLEDLF